MTMLTHPNEEELHEVLRLLGALDGPPVTAKASDIIARAQRKSRLAMHRVAASVALVATLAGVAYAVSGAPLRAWLRSAVSRVTRETSPPPPAAGPSSSQPAIATSGIAVAPGARFVIRFAAPRLDSEALVSFTDDSTISVRTTLGAATFTSDTDRLVIEPHAASLSVEIAIPRLAPRVEIQVAGKRVFLKNGNEITASDAPDSRERYRIALTTSRR
ncbi:MAG: hypothetical protein ACREOG_07790 [Gemmatimonadaceae bacterium]